MTAPASPSSLSSVASLMDTAVLVARAAGAIQRDARSREIVVIEKGAADLTTDVDAACERAIVDGIKARHPDHAILAEEGTAHTGTAPYLWIVDPLDGTKNFAHGYPRSCVSVAVSENGKVIVGVVYNPHSDELFAAAHGEGATMNGSRISVSRTKTLSRAMVASALTYETSGTHKGDHSDEKTTRRRADRDQLERLARVLGAAEALRSDGCCALDLCDVARGRFDAYFERGLKAWDTAAGALIVREAGGRTSDFLGAPHDPFGLDTLAANPDIHAELVALMSA